MLNQLRNAGVDTDGVIIDHENPTGYANIYVSDTGENNIVVYPGANNTLDISQIKASMNLIKRAQYCVLQHEVPLDVVQYVIQVCSQEGIICVLNPAPWKQLPRFIFSMVDYLIPNETELKMISGISSSVDAAANQLIESGVPNLIVTLGAQGSKYFSKNESGQFPIIGTEVIDTTAAGDSFVGSFVVALTEGANLNKAIEFATCTASITVSRLGAFSSLPSRDEVDQKLRTCGFEKNNCC